MLTAMTSRPSHTIASGFLCRGGGGEDVPFLFPLHLSCGLLRGSPVSRQSDTRDPPRVFMTKLSMPSLQGWLLSVRAPARPLLTLI
ncbi:hypothetical protein GQ53DRAFT_215440 [Thozetella sp. PMI_491]|nr:hypothetical protein GQ53DRAFT_215440 [Thozetella sp. PMI_491]